MKILVTGAHGQVGSEMSAFLAGHDVTALGRDALDLRDADAIRRVVERSEPDAVVNCAAYNAVDKAEEEPDVALSVNGHAVAVLAEACAAGGAHLVHVSTDYVFAGDKDGPYVESDTPDPRSAYGRSKRAGEEALAESDATWALVRTAWVFGTVGRSFVETMLRLGAEGAPLRVVDDQRGSPTYARDLASVLAALATRRLAGVYHVTNAGTCTWFEFAREALEVAGLDPDLVEPISTADFGRPAPRPANSVLASTRLASVGLAPLRHYREALEEMVAAIASTSEA